MRAVTNSTLDFYRRSQADMGRLRETIERLQTQVATGERLERSSDDPVAAARLRALDRQDRLGTIDSANARRVAEDLQATDQALGTIADALIRARELALHAGSNTIGDSERGAIAIEIEELRQGILAAANAQGSSGNALFAGETGTAAYVADASGAVAYVGAASAGTIALGQNQSVARGLTGPEALAFTSGGSATDLFVHLAALTAALRGGSTDPAQSARDALAGFDDALDSVTRAQTITGARIAWLDVVQDRQNDQSLTRAQQAADTGGTELTSTIAELQQMLTVLEASQASFARVANLSLFDKI